MERSKYLTSSFTVSSHANGNNSAGVLRESDCPMVSLWGFSCFLKSFVHSLAFGRKTECFITGETLSTILELKRLTLDNVNAYRSQGCTHTHKHTPTHDLSLSLFRPTSAGSIADVSAQSWEDSHWSVCCILKEGRYLLKLDSKGRTKGLINRRYGITRGSRQQQQNDEFISTIPACG